MHRPSLTLQVSPSVCKKSGSSLSLVQAGRHPSHHRLLDSAVIGTHPYTRLQTRALTNDCPNTMPSQAGLERPILMSDLGHASVHVEMDGNVPHAGRRSQGWVPASFWGRTGCADSCNERVLVCRYLWFRCDNPRTLRPAQTQP